MQNYNGKYRKQPHKQKYIITGIVGTALVLSLFAIVFYKLGELSVGTSREPVSETAALMQETYTEPPSTTETTTVATTEATTAPIETMTAPLMQTQPTVTPTVAPTVPSTQTGTVLRSAGQLKVRSGAGTNYEEIGRLQGGDAVTIYEQQNVNGMTWGNIGYGWVSMNYIVFGADHSQATNTPAQNSQNLTGTVLRSAGQLKVRSGAGTNYTEIGRLQGGDTVTIYEQQNANGMTWGNIGYGWVSMDYIVFGVDNSQAPTTPQQSTINPPTQNTFNKRQACIGDWVSSDGRFNMTLTSNGNGVDIYIEFRYVANTPSVTYTWKMTGAFDEYDTIQYSHGVRTDTLRGPDEPAYIDGAGTITIYQSQLEWYEYREHIADPPTVFYRVGSYIPSTSGTNSNQGSSTQNSSGGLSGSISRIPKRYDNESIRPVMEGIVKTELGYRYGDDFKVTSCSISSYYSHNGQYEVFIRGTWNKKTFRVTAVLQDNNGALTLVKVREVYVK